MGIKSLLSLRVATPILIVAAFLLGRFTASRPPVETGHADSISTASVAIPPGQNVVGFLDMVQGKPSILTQRDGEVQLSGWAACVAADSPVVKIEILVDDKLKADAVTSSSRPDVAAAYGRPDFEKSGWKASFSAHGMETGEHALKALVTCSKGEAGVLPAFTLDIHQ
jgi:hypothetical protein